MLRRTFLPFQLAIVTLNIAAGARASAFQLYAGSRVTADFPVTSCGFLRILLKPPAADKTSGHEYNATLGITPFLSNVAFFCDS